MKFFLSIILSIGLLGSAKAQTCEISEKVKLNIAQLLCEQFAIASEYNLDGETCGVMSHDTRSEDTVAIIIDLDVCGFHGLSDKYELASIRIVSVISKLSKCIGVTEDLSMDIPSIRAQIIQSNTELTCESQHRSFLENRIPEWQIALDEILDPNYELLYLEKLGLTQDHSGNIFEIEN